MNTARGETGITIKDQKSDTTLADIRHGFRGLYASRNKDLIRYIFVPVANEGDAIVIAFRVRRSRALGIVEAWNVNDRSAIDSELITDDGLDSTTELTDVAISDEPTLAAAMTCIATLRLAIDQLLITADQMDAALADAQPDMSNEQLAFMNNIYVGSFQSGKTVIRDIYAISYGPDPAEVITIAFRTNLQTRTESIEIANGAFTRMHTQWRSPALLNERSPKVGAFINLLLTIEKRVYPKGSR